MVNPNIEALSKKIVDSPELQERVRALEGKSPEEVATALAQLSQAEGIPVTEDDFLQRESAEAALSDSDLETVSGGAWRPSQGNLLASILGLGLTCGVFAVFSASKGNADNCQPDQHHNLR